MLACVTDQSEDGFLILWRCSDWQVLSSRDLKLPKKGKSATKEAMDVAHTMDYPYDFCGDGLFYYRLRFVTLALEPLG